MNIVKVKAGQVWKDKKTEDTMYVISRNHDVIFNCSFARGNRSHHISEFVINKYYLPVKV